MSLAAHATSQALSRSASDETIGHPITPPASEEDKLAGVRWARLMFCSVNNNVMTVAMPIARLEKIRKNGQGKPMSVFGTPVMADVIAPGSGLSCVGEPNLVPQMDTLRVLPHQPDVAVVLGEFFNRSSDAGAGLPSQYCARGFLKRQLAQLKSEFGYEPVVGLEIEFTLFKGFDPETKLPIPLDDFVYCEDKMWASPGGAFITEYVDLLMKLGIEVYTFHPEGGPGQYELALGPCPMLRAADNMLFARNALHFLAAKHGLIATTAPKPIPDQPGNGAHIHISLSDAQGKNVVPDPGRPKGLGRDAEAFMAGILDHLGAIPALSMPSANSYGRVSKRMWAGCYYICWGVENRECAARVASPPYGGSYNNIEFRPSDGSANPYFSFGAYLAAGMDGLRRGFELGPDVKGDPADLTPEEVAALGLKELPRSLPEALDNLERDEALRDAMGPDLLRAYTATKRFEYETISKWPVHEQVKLFVTRY